MPPDLPGLAVHVGAGRPAGPRHAHWPAVRSWRDTLERMSRLATAAGITRQHQLLGSRASRAEVTDTCYAAALSRFTIPATVVLLAACGPDQEILANPATGFAARLERLMLADGQPNPACTSYLWLSRQFRRDSPDVERPQVWTNRPSVWSQRPFRHPPAPVTDPGRRLG